MDASLVQAYEVDLTQANTCPYTTSSLKENTPPCTKWEYPKDILLDESKSVDGVDEVNVYALKYVM